MKPEEQRIAIAEARGYRYMTWGRSQNYFLVAPEFKPVSFLEAGRPPKGVELRMDDVPDYPKDLNAMRSAELTLTSDQLKTYDGWLIILSDESASRRASSTIRAEAFLRTLSLWKE